MGGTFGHTTVPAQEAEIEAAKRKAAETLKAARDRKLARADDVDLDLFKSKPKKAKLSEFLSTDKKTSAGKLVAPL